jgi:hypothetical protein
MDKLWTTNEGARTLNCQLWVANCQFRESGCAAASLPVS